MNVTGTCRMTAKHVLEECPTYTELRKLYWPTPALWRCEKPQVDCCFLQFNLMSECVQRKT